MAWGVMSEGTQLMHASIDRLERERQFHDARFAGGEDDRAAQMKYYVAEAMLCSLCKAQG